MSASITIGRPGQFREFERYAKERFEQAALRATQRAARQATTEIRAALPGRLGGAIGTGSDLAKSGRAHLTAGGFSASGWVHIRGRSARAEGAIQAATEGATITPLRGRWLAIASKQIPARAGRYKMTPSLYRSSGLEQSIGPLEFIPGRKRGEMLAIVRSVSVDRFRRRGRHARRLTGRKLHASRERRDFIVAFILIRATTRARLVDPNAILAANAAKLPALLGEELRKEMSNGRG